MKTMAIRDLKNNPSALTKALENHESVFISKHGKPIGLTLPLTDQVIGEGLIKASAIEAYKNNQISLGKFAQLIGVDKNEAMRILSDLKIDMVEYETNELLSDVQGLFS
jgi:predicted HTH domain antitoxin